jgi:hypothetical protein
MMTKQERINSYKAVIDELRADGNNKLADRVAIDPNMLMLEREAEVFPLIYSASTLLKNSDIIYQHWIVIKYDSSG